MNICQLVLLFLMLFVYSGYSQQSEITTKWQSEKYKNPEKLSKLDFLYDSKGKLFYLLTNDKDNLFVHLRAIDETTQRKLIDFGFSIEIISKGANKKKLVVDYPLPKTERMEPIILLADNVDHRKNNFNKAKSQIVDQITELRITDYSIKKGSIIIPANNESNINGKMAIIENGELQYVLVIPLSKINIDLAEDSQIKIKMRSGSLDVSVAPSLQAAGENDMNPGGRSGGMGGGYSQGMNGGRPGGREGDFENKEQRMAERQALTAPIKIVLKKVTLLSERINSLE